MNEYKRAYFIGAAETAARTAGKLFHDSPILAEMSIKLSYCYILAANGKIEEARAYLLNEHFYAKNIFEGVLEHAERVVKSFDN